MHPRLQAKLLRAVQEREIDRVGGSQPIKVDIRLLATSNRDLEEEVRKGDGPGAAVQFPLGRGRRVDAVVHGKIRDALDDHQPLDFGRRPSDLGAVLRLGGNGK